MEALRKVYNDAPDEILVPVPLEWRHRRIEVVISALDGCEEAVSSAATPAYRVVKVDRRVIANRDSLHER